MDKVKEILREKDFVINSLILKNIKNFNLSINEFLLLLYFINIEEELDIEKINKYLLLSKEEIFASFENLIKKNLIEVKVSRKNKVVEEKISLDNFYNKLVFNMPKEEVKTDIYSEFEKEFGRTLSPTEYETINGWINSNISEQTIKEALKEAILNGVTSLRYIDKIIYEWNKKDFKIKKESSDLSENVKVFDYNWLEDESES